MKKVDWQKIFYRCIGIVALASLLAFCQSYPLPAPSRGRLPSSEQSLFVDEVWAGTDLRYDAVSVGPIVYIAYYDAERRFSVARVDTATRAVVKKTLNSVFGGWDSHNRVVLAYDRKGYLHVAGNMHAMPLVYARTTRPKDFNSLTQINRMTGEAEAKVTYPSFSYSANGDLLFSYRSGVAGNGETFVDRFDGERWSRLLSQPLFGPVSQSDPVSAYPTGFTASPDGYYHVAWVWHKPGGTQNSFNVCYARSKDLVHWEDSRGRALTLPITPSNAEVVDSIPPNGGLLNYIKLGFDNGGRPIISYMKYDEQGNSQIYHGRLRTDGWQIVRSTDWKYRWEFSGIHTLVAQISFSGVRSEGNHLVEDVSHKRYGRMGLELDPLTLSARIIPARAPSTPKSDNTAAFSGPYMTKSVKIRRTTNGSVHGEIRWQTLPADNDDKPRSCESVGLPSGCKITSRLEIVNLDAR